MQGHSMMSWKCLLLCDTLIVIPVGEIWSPSDTMQTKEHIKKIFADRAPVLYYAVKQIALRTEALIRRSSPQEIIFTRIHRGGGWSGGESPSGVGSTLEHTEKIRNQLPKILSEYEVAVLLDIPCGDFHWLREVDLGKIVYIGADIVKALVEENSRKYASERKKFLHLDLLADPLPPSDAILCRDCLPHLPFQEIFRAIRNVKRSGAKYLLTSDYPACRENRDIRMGRFRPVDFLRAPFFFPPPLFRIDDFDGLNESKSLALWRVSDIPQA